MLKKAPSAKPWEILSFLRFGLAWIVFCSHFKDFGVAHLPAIAFFVNFDGRAAVLGFLIVSGYSIAHSLHQNPKGFLWRRFIRLYPLYLTAMLVTQGIALFLGPQVELPTFTFHQTGHLTTLCNLFFLQTFACVSLGYNPVVWSLAIEVFYYVLAPVFDRINHKILFTLAMLSGVFSVFLNTVVVDGSNTPAWIYFFGVTAFSHLWAWLFGFLSFKFPQKPYGLLLILIGVLFISLNAQQFYGRFSVLTYIISFVLLLYAPILGSWLSPQVSSLFLYLGNLSYPLYLFHLPVLLVGHSILQITQPLILTILTLAAAAVFYQFVDVYLKRTYLLKLPNYF